MRAVLFLLAMSCALAQQQDSQDPRIEPLHTTVTITATPAGIVTCR